MGGEGVPSGRTGSSSRPCGITGPASAVVKGGVGAGTGGRLYVFVSLRCAVWFSRQEAGVYFPRAEFPSAEGDQRFHAKAKWYELDSAGRKVGSWNLKHLSRCLSPTDGFICRRSALQRGGVGGAPL
jgi:hypothetical protein